MTFPFGTYASRRMPFDICNALVTFHICMIFIFFDLVEHYMEILMGNFSVFCASFNDCLASLGKVLKKVDGKTFDFQLEKVSLYGEEGDYLRSCIF